MWIWTAMTIALGVVLFGMMGWLLVKGAKELTDE